MVGSLAGVLLIKLPWVILRTLLSLIKMTRATKENIFLGSLKPYSTCNLLGVSENVFGVLENHLDPWIAFLE